MKHLGVLQKRTSWELCFPLEINSGLTSNLPEKITAYAWQSCSWNLLDVKRGLVGKLLKACFLGVSLLHVSQADRGGVGGGSLYLHCLFFEMGLQFQSAEPSKGAFKRSRWWPVLTQVLQTAAGRFLSIERLCGEIHSKGGTNQPTRHPFCIYNCMLAVELTIVET